MHWTALLAYRRFPINAQVIDDLPCIGCGYNLRGARAGGRCPECSALVGDSFFVLAKPQIVGRTIRGVGVGFFSILALLLGCINGWSTPWMLIVSTAILALGSAWRFLSVIELRLRGKIEHLPVVGARMMALWVCAALNAMAAFAWFGASLAIVKIPSWQNPAGEQLVYYAATAWMAMTLLSAFAAGWFGLALATMLGHAWIRIEFKVQLIGVALAVLVVLLVLATRGFVVSSRAALAMFGVLVLVPGGTVLFTALSLLHLANAAEHEDEMWEEVVE